MHFEFLTEDVSGKRMLEDIVPQILQAPDSTYAIHSYKGIGGKLPQNLKSSPESIRHRILLDNLPRLLAGYGRTFLAYGKNYRAAIIVVCDLDRRDRQTFENELHDLLKRCATPPTTHFCLAIEEGEAWFLGDLEAIRQAYPQCDMRPAQQYRQDSICGTWELLADMLCKGGHTALSLNHGVGTAKFQWAKNISPHMNVEANSSPSFCNFRDTVRKQEQLSIKNKGDSAS